MPIEPLPIADTPLLAELADHCLNGACNPIAILNSLAEVRRTYALQQEAFRTHPAIKVILGHLCFLSQAHGCIGPSEIEFAEYQVWRTGNGHARLAALRELTNQPT